MNNKGKDTVTVQRTLLWALIQGIGEMAAITLPVVNQNANATDSITNLVASADEAKEIMHSLTYKLALAAKPDATRSQ